MKVFKTINWKVLILMLVVGAFTLGTVNAQIQERKKPINPYQFCVVPKINGDKVPFPLRNANTKYDLAQDETYLLTGTIVLEQGKMQFKIDFDSQPWLATQRRIQFPFFMIDSKDSTMIKKFNGALVQMVVVVRKTDVSTNGQEWNSGLVISPITTPIYVKK